MTEHESDVRRATVSRSSGEPAWRRRRRLDAVFGTVLPETTSDERDAGTPDADAGDRWLKAQVPPHHG